LAAAFCDIATSPSRVASAEGEAGGRRRVAIIDRLAFDDKRADQRRTARRRRPLEFRLELPVAAAIRPENSQPGAFYC
jgi:hypothetical protein